MWDLAQARVTWKRTGIRSGTSRDVGDAVNRRPSALRQVLHVAANDVEARFIEGAESFVEEDRLEFRGAGRGEGGDLQLEGERECEGGLEALFFSAGTGHSQVKSASLWSR